MSRSSSPKPKRAQLGLTTLAHLALDLRQRGHARLELLPRNDLRRLVQLISDPGERRNRRRRCPCAVGAALILILIFALGLVLGFGFAR